MKKFFLSIALTVMAVTGFAQFANKVELRAGFGVDYQTSKTEIEAVSLGQLATDDYSETISTTQISASVGASYFVTNNFQIGLGFDFIHQEGMNVFGFELPLSYWHKISETFYWTPTILGAFSILTYSDFDEDYSGFGFEVQPLTFAAKISEKFLAKVSLFSFSRVSLDCDDMISYSTNALRVGGPQVGLSFLL